MNQNLLLTLAQTAPPADPWPGPLTYIGVGMLILAAVIYVLNRRAPRAEDDQPADVAPPQDKE